eukprot:7865286-Lingulodinium_polyedra.AAC.1
MKCDGRLIHHLCEGVGASATQGGATLICQIIHECIQRDPAERGKGESRTGSVLSQCACRMSTTALG